MDLPFKEPSLKFQPLLRALGSIHLALFLILTSAILVIAATFIESNTNSHEAAEKFIYKTPLFYFLLSLYFVNILFSALSRYPFKKKHIPFLITHLGLLMIIAGVFIKGIFGVQGEISLIEGTFTDKLIKKDVKSIVLQTKEKTIFYPILNDEIVQSNDDTPKIKLLKTYPNGEEKWIIGSNKIDPKEVKKIIVYDEGYEGYSINVEKKMFQMIDWEKIDKDLINLLFWHQELFSKPDLLKTYPFREDEEKSKESVARDLFAIKESLPQVELKIDDSLKERLLNSFTYYFGNDYDSLPIINQKFLEEPIQREIISKTVSEKNDENREMVDLLIDGKTISLLFEPNSPALKWPLFDKKHLISFQPHQITLPFSIELLEARNVLYPNGKESNSYECDLIIREKGELLLKTLSMNEVYETEDGYRLYLAGIGEIDSHGVKKAHLVVNKDPAKYALTYPGGLLVAIGICLLFFAPKTKS